MEDLQVEDFNDPIEHKAEQTSDGIKTPEKQESDEEQTSIFKEIMSWVIPFAIA
ncbi:MAG TPA: signal peptidase I, partial [Roseburia sp.]|nr:signal peptidase I [Roseburia sp.]